MSLTPKTTQQTTLATALVIALIASAAQPTQVLSALTVRTMLYAFVAFCSAYKEKVRKAVVPGFRTALLSWPSKMPGPSWSLPAHKSCPRAWGTICDLCYAAKGCYQFASTRLAQHIRFQWTVECMRSAVGIDLWVSTMVRAIVGCEYFRVHDSGDMFNATYARAWLRVMTLCPGTKFWLPTRAYQGGVMGDLPLFDPMLETLRLMAKLPNVTVRPSALNFGDYAPKVPGLHAGSTADNPDVFRLYQCPAKRLYEGNCGPCRFCWEEKTVPVNYPKH